MVFCVSYVSRLSRLRLLSQYLNLTEQLVSSVSNSVDLDLDTKGACWLPTPSEVKQYGDPCTAYPRPQIHQRILDSKEDLLVRRREQIES